MKKALFFLMATFVAAILGDRAIQFIFDLDPMVEKLTSCLKQYSSTKDLESEVKSIRLARRVQVAATQQEQAYTDYTFIVQLKGLPNERVTLRVFGELDEEGYSCERLWYNSSKG